MLTKLATTALVVLHVGLMGTFVLGYLARYVPPSTAWWLQLFGIALPYAGLAVLAGVLLTGLTGQRVPFVLYLVLGVLFGVRYAPRVPARPPSEDTPLLRVLSFNADPTYLSDPQPMRALLRAQQPDVVALQEAWVQRLESGYVHAATALLPLVRSEAFDIEEPEGGWTGEALRLPVFARLEWVRLETLPFEGAAQESDRGQAVRAELLWHGQRIAVYNLHLHSFGPERPWREGWRQRLSPLAWLRAFLAWREDFLMRELEARQVRAWLETEPLPFLVCGDFNTTPDQWVHAHLARGLTDTFAAAGRGFGATYHARLPLVRIDHILASPHWRVVSARVLRDGASDHRPVGAVLFLHNPP